MIFTWRYYCRNHRKLSTVTHSFVDYDFFVASHYIIYIHSSFFSILYVLMFYLLCTCGTVFGSVLTWKKDNKILRKKNTVSNSAYSLKAVTVCQTSTTSFPPRTVSEQIISAKKYFFHSCLVALLLLVVVFIVTLRKINSNRTLGMFACFPVYVHILILCTSRCETFETSIWL